MRDNVYGENARAVWNNIISYIHLVHMQQLAQLLINATSLSS